MSKSYNIYNIEAEFKNYLESLNISRVSINNYLADFRSFLSWFTIKLKSQQLEFDLRLFNEEIMDSYRNHLIDKHVPVKTINRHFSTLRAFSKLCLTHNWISNNPFSDLHGIKKRQTIPFLYQYKKSLKTFFIFLLGFGSILLLFIIPSAIVSYSRQNSSLNSLLLRKDLPISTGQRIASTSADLLTIPIIDEKGNLNLSASYPKIMGYNGTLTIDAPQLSLASREKGNIILTVKDGSIQFSFEGMTPPLPYQSAFYFSARDLKGGTLIMGQTTNTGNSINLLELSSGIPSEAKFKVDADGNVYIKGNVVLDGNLIVNPSSNIFGNLASETATSSFSPEP